ncbi:TetR family transcriptional regulator [Oerskovia jenensis]|uniref:AcrR family transcriptional regulator n=1 Tax=Oerskovia jenensis TaxID=162169 RepID=A0ABS2LAF0_9CELL|nr:TetR family transcriptional regulator [Oerskovia jenensis]MBM7477337.1 AcrR family transcriptional regulator [Oerskovia jenensis]
MSRTPDEYRRTQLVAGALDHLQNTGLSGFTLRSLAPHLGTSARMLVHYFGTRDALLEAVLVEHRRRTIAALDAVADTDPRVVARSAWAGMTDPAHTGHLTLMLQVLTTSLEEGSPHREIAQDAVTAWVVHVERLLVGTGRTPDAARVDATLLTSGFKGLLLDRLVTGDLSRTDAAAQRLVDLLLAP